MNPPSKTFSVIVAIDAHFGIGQDGKLPWHLSGDLKQFKKVTTGSLQRKVRNIVVMGRKTWESIPSKFRPLPDRINLVLTRNSDLTFPASVYKASSLDAAFQVINDDLRYIAGDVFIIGGAEIFEQAVKHPGCHKLYLTHVLENFPCDTFFPKILTRFRKIEQSETFREGENSYYFAEYVRQAGT